MASIKVVLTNQNHVFPTNPSGIVTTLEGSGTDIEVYVDKLRATPTSSVEISGALKFTVEVLEENNVKSGDLLIDSENKKITLEKVFIDNMINFTKDELVEQDSLAKGTITLLIKASDQQGVISQATRELVYKKSAKNNLDPIDVEVGTVIAISNTKYTTDGGTNFSVPIWYRDDQEIVQSQFYIVTNEDMDKTITSFVTYVDDKGQEQTLFLVKNVNVVDSPAYNFPVIIGSPALGEYLDVDNSFIYDRNEVGNITSSWYIGNELLTENTSSFMIPKNEIYAGETVKVVSTYIDGAGKSNTLESPSLYIYDSSDSDAVIIENENLQLGGQAGLGDTLSSSIFVVEGILPENVEYQWRRNGKIIPDTNETTYTIRRADIGKNISLTARYEINGQQRMKVSNVIRYKNSVPSGQPYISYPSSGEEEEGGSIASVASLPTHFPVGQEVEVFVEDIEDISDIKQFYYPLDTLSQIQIIEDRDRLLLDSTLNHTAVYVEKTFIPSIGEVREEETDVIEFTVLLNIQSIWVNSDLVSADDVIIIQYLDENDVWQDALTVTGPSTRMHILEENIISSKWRSKYITTRDSINYNYSLESPSSLESRIFSYVWSRTNDGIEEVIPGAVNKRYLITPDDLNSTLKVQTFFVDGANQPKSLLSSNTIQVSGYKTSGLVFIDGNANVGKTLRLISNIRSQDNVTEDNPQGVVTDIDKYEWLADGAIIENQESYSLFIDNTLANKTITAKLYYTDALGVQNSVTAANSVKTNKPAEGLPYILGTPKVGKTLILRTENVTDDNGIGSKFYSWIRQDNEGNQEQIPNATSQQYVVQNEDVGKKIRGVFQFIDLAEYPEELMSDPVTILDSETTGEPIIVGNVVTSNEVTADTSGVIDNNGIASIEYQWMINGQEVDGATSETFTIPSSQDIEPDSYINVKIKVTDSNGFETFIFSQEKRIATLVSVITPETDSTVVNDNLTVQIPAGSVDENIQIVVYETKSEEFVNLPEGSTITGSAWVLTPHGTTFENPITLTFTVPEGANIILRADDDNSPYFEIVENVNIVNNVASIQTNTFSVYVGASFSPTIIKGIPQQGYYLTASIIGNVIDDLSLQWSRNDIQIENETEITYLVKGEDVDQQITVEATFAAEDGLRFTRKSDPVLIVNSPAQGTVDIVGNLRTGDTLTAVPTNVIDRNLLVSPSYSYQWKNNSVPIQNATNSEYVVTEDDYLSQLSVTAYFTDSLGKQETIESSVVLISETGDVAITGLEKQGQVYGIDTTNVEDLYKIYDRKYQWYADGEKISGATQKQRTLSTIESGKNVSIEFSYVDGRGTPSSLRTEERFVYTLKETVTPAGGVFENAGVKINIPAGAVSQDTEIMAYVSPYDKQQLPIGILSEQPAYAFAPLNLAFQQPIEITLSKPNDEYDMIIYGSDNTVNEFIITDDDFLTVDNENNTVTIQTENFGVFISSILYVRIDVLGTPEQGQTLNTLFTGEVFSKTYQWYRGEDPIAGETEPSYVVTLQDVGEQIKVISTYLLEEGSNPEVVESQAVTIVNSSPIADTSSIISGEDRVGETLTADPSSITDANNPEGIGQFLYQWKVEGQDIDGEFSDIMVIQASHFQKNITVEITYIDAAGLLESVTSEPLYISRIPPSGFVEVVGIPEVDELLEVDTDNLVDLNGIGEFSYQWRADGVNLDGETNSTLLVTSAMENKAIDVVLTYTDGVGEVETVTSQNAPVIDADPTGAVTIDYTILEVAQTLTANTSTIADANSPGGISGFTYQWSSNGTPINGATNVNYVVANQFCNTDITVTVTFTDGDGYIESLTSDPVTIENSPVQGQPTVSGDPEVGSVLTINTDGLISDVNVVGTLNYKWFADDLEISGATEKTWTVLENSYVGKVITGQIYYTDGAGNFEQADTSNSVTIVNSLPSGQPIVEGTLQVGQTLTALTGAISDPNIIVQPFTYQWYANGELIQDATGSDYVVQVSDINKTITVDASYYDEGSTFETATSVGYTIVNTPATGAIDILYPNLQQGSWLTASVNVTDDNVIVSDYSYVWKRDGSNIKNATNQHYQLGYHDWGHQITVSVSFTDTGGVIETINSTQNVQMVDTQPTGEISITDTDNQKVGEDLIAYTSDIVDGNLIKNFPSPFISMTSPSVQDWGYTKEVSKIYIHRYKGGISTLKLIDENDNEIDVLALTDSPNFVWGVYDKNPANEYYTFVLPNPIRAKGHSTTWFTQEFRNPGSTWRTHYAYQITLNFYEVPTEESKDFTYQWNRDGQAIIGAVEKIYTPTFDDLYTTLTVDVDFEDFHGNTYRAANTASIYIENSPPEGTVLINGTRNVGESLYFTHNVVDRDNITVDNPTGAVTFSSYQWYQSDFEDGELTPISGAVSASLLLTPELQAKWIALDATYVDSEGDDDTVHSSNRLAVKSSPTGNAIITSADLQLGRQVFLDTSTIADLNDLGEFSYQWYRTEGTGSIAISGAVQTHYSYQPADLGENIYCIVSYVDGDGDQEHVTSNNLGPVVQTSGSVGAITIDSSSEINGEITSDVQNIFAMNNFETVAPVVAYNFHSDTRDVSPNGLHLAGTNFAFDADGGLDLSHSTSAYLRTNGTTPVLNNETHTVAFRVKRKGTASQWTKIFTFGSSVSYGNPEVWLTNNNSKKLTIDWKQIGTDTSADFLTTPDLEQDVWYDIMFVKQGNVGRLYVDGVLVQTNNSLPNPSDRADSRIEFGYRDSTYVAAPVIIKDFQIFDFAVDDYTNASNYPFYTEPTLSYQWKADGNPIAGETNATLQLTGGNNDLGKDITLEVSLTDALGNARTLESNTSVVVGSELVQVERFLLEDGSEMLQEDGSSFLSETVTTDISLPLSVDGDLLDFDTVFAVNGESTEDLSAYKNNISLGGNLTVSTTEKKFGNSSYYFDGGGNTGLQIPSSDLLDLRNTDWTMEAWIYPDGNYSDYRMIMSRRSYSQYDYQVYLEINTGEIRFAADSGGGVHAGVTPTANQWSHVAVVRKDGVITIYLNGEAANSGTVDIAYDRGHNLGIGNTGDLSRHPFRGYIDDARIVKGVALYGENFSVATSSYIVEQRVRVGDTVSVDVSSVTDPNGLSSVEYQWYADNTSILNATGSSFIVTNDEIAKDLRIKAVFEDTTGRKSARLSDEIAVSNTPATGSVTIAGTFEKGSILLATPSISDVDGIVNVEFDYQWMLDGADIPNQTESTYTLRNGDVGKEISVKATFVDKGATIETIASAASTVLDSAGSGQIQILGQSSVGSILTADTSGVSDPNGILEFIYQWKRDGVAISGATSQFYALTPDDHNKTITVDVSYIDNKNVVFNVDARNRSSYSGAGSTVYDLSDYDVDMSVNGMTFLPDEKTGMFNFDGNDWLQGTLKNQAGDWAHTIEFVIQANVNQSSMNGPIFQIGHGGTNNTVSALWISNNHFNWYNWNNDTVYNTNVLVQGEYYHFVLSYVGNGATTTNKSFYINGIKQNIAASGGSYGQLLNLAANSKIQIGRRDYDGYYSNVRFAYMRVFNRGLSQDEAENLYMAQQDLYELPEITPTGTTNINVVTSNDSVYVDKASPTGTVTIEGTREILNTLTATNTIADQDGLGTFSYQWHRNGAVIVGATSSTFLIPRDYIGQSVHVIINYTDGNGDVESVVSDVVQIKNVTTGTLTLSGTPSLGQTLSADLANDDFYYLPKQENLVFGLDADIAGVKDHVTNTEMTYGFDAFKNSDGFYEFDGSSDHISIPDNSSLDFNGEITVSVWFKTHRTNVGQQNLIGKGGGWNRAGFLLTAHYDYFRMHLGNGSSERNIDTTAVRFANNTWNHVVATWKDNYIYVYLNGQLIATSSAWSNGHYENNYPLYIGGMAGNEQFPLDGEIAQARVYNAAMTDAEVLDFYNNTKGRFENNSYSFDVVANYQWYRMNANGLFEEIEGAKGKYYNLVNADVEKNIKVVVNYTTVDRFQHQLSQAVVIENTQPTGQIVINNTNPINGRDLYDEYLSLYLPLEENSLDHSDYHHRISGPVPTTDYAKFGEKSAYFYSTIPNIPTNSAFDFGTGDFTIETWAYKTSYGAWNTIYSHTHYTTGLMLRVISSGNMDVYLAGNRITAYNGAFPLNQWNHVALTRDNGFVRLFVNGTKVAEGYMPWNIANGSVNIGTSHHVSNEQFTGYLEDFVVLKGFARYTENFQVPTSNFQVYNIPFEQRPPFGEGDVYSGQQLQIDTQQTSIVDQDTISGEITYKWKIDNSVVATGNSYQVQGSDIGKQLQVVGTYLDGLGKIEEFVQNFGTVQDSVATGDVTLYSNNPVYTTTYTGDENFDKVSLLLDLETSLEDQSTKQLPTSVEGQVVIHKEASEIITDGLTLHLDVANTASYDPNQTSVISDLSNTNGDLNLVGMFYDTSGDIKSLQFGNDQGDRIYQNNSNIIGGFNTYTFEMWLKFDSTQTSQSILSYATSTSNNNELLFFKVGNDLDIVHNHSYSRRFSEFFNGINYTSWHHYAFVSTPTELRVYRDGYLFGVQSNPSTGNFTGGGYLAFGQEQDSRGGSFDNNQDLVAKISQVRMYADKALTDEEIEQNFNATRAAFGTSTSGGYAQNTAFFDGNNNHIIVPPSEALDLSDKDWTIEAWINPTAIRTDETAAIATKRQDDSASNRDFSLWLNPTDGELRFQTAYGSNIYTGYNVPIKQWTHVAVVRSGTTITVYADGVARASADYDLPYNSSTSLYIGDGVTLISSFWGYIRNFRITKGLARYTSDFTPAETFTLGTEVKTLSGYQTGSVEMEAGTVVQVNTGSLGDIDGIASYSYKWYADDRLLAAETGETLTITEDILKDQNVKVEVTVTDQNNNSTVKTAMAHSIPRDGLVLHLDAKDTASIDHSAGIWRDLSGQENHLYWNSSYDLDGNFLAQDVVRTNAVKSLAKPLASQTYNGMPTGREPWSATVVIRPGELDDNNIIISFGRAASSVIAARAHPLAWFSNRFAGGGNGGLGLWSVSTSGQAVPTTTDYWVLTSTYDGFTERLYVNGVLDKSASLTMNIPTSGNDITFFWPFGTVYGANADYGMVAIHNRTLSAEEAAEIYDSYKHRFRIEGARGILRTADIRLLERAVKEGDAFSLDLSTLFYGLDNGNQTISVVQANGDALPSWLSYDGGTYTLSGTPAEGDAEELKVVLISTDSSGTFTEVITIDVVSSSQTSAVDTHQHYDWRGVDDPAGIISSKELSNNITDWEGKFEWNSIQDVTFGQPPDVEESFEDLSWSGATRFDWTDIEDPNSTYQTADLSGITEFSSQFVWKDIVQADFGETAENILEENFEDDSWTGFTRVDWTGVTDPAAVAAAADIQGVWTGIHDWRNNPTPGFASDKTVVSEEFEDVTWSGLTRFDWATVEDPISLASSYGLSGLWEGKFLWAGKPEPTFSEKSLKLEEDFDDDWTI